MRYRHCPDLIRIYVSETFCYHLHGQATIRHRRVPKKLSPLGKLLDQIRCKLRGSRGTSFFLYSKKYRFFFQFSRSSTDKLDEDKNDPATASKQHDFIRTHFQRSTQCDFCGKKIWLKDAVQCQNCSMCCHKKCINKCQNSTICGPVEAISTLQPQVEFKVTDADVNDDELEESDEVSSRWVYFGYGGVAYMDDVNWM